MNRRTELNVYPLEGRTLLSALSISLKTSASVYEMGEPVNLTFTETNTSGAPITIREGPSIDGFVIEQGSNIVWRSNGGINPLYIMDDTLEPGQSFTVKATWDGASSAGNSTASADTGTFVVMNQLDPQVTATFQIVGPISPPSSPISPSPTPPTSPISPSPTPPTSPVSPSPTPPTSPISPSPTPPTSPSSPSPTSPSDPAAPNPTPPTPVSSPNPVPIIATPATTSSAGKHKHADQHHTHHQVAKPAHIPQLALKIHHPRAGTK